MVDMPYEDFIRSRITELRMARDVSEHRMSLELGKSGSYIRGVTSGAAYAIAQRTFQYHSVLQHDTGGIFLLHWKMMIPPIISSVNS